MDAITSGKPFDIYYGTVSPSYDEIESLCAQVQQLRAQVEELIAGAIVRADKQAILLEGTARLRAQLAHAQSLIGVMSNPTFEVQP